VIGSGGAGTHAYDVTGGLLPRDLLERIDAGDKEIPGIGAGSYGLQAGESVRRYASRSWPYLLETWRELRRQLDNAPTSRHTELTRQRWLLILLRELGFDRVSPTPAGGITVDGTGYPVSHTWHGVPLHLLGWNTPLDTRSKGVAGAAGAAPQSLVQRLLNVSDRHLWGLLSNGARLRLLRDSTSLAGSAYLEFDLAAIFDGELYSDFVLLYLTCHSSRFVPQDEPVGPASCWLEQWRGHAAEQGVRALDQLRGGVEEAIRRLGTGFLDHPANHGLRGALERQVLRIDDLNRALLRAVYRLLFWFVADDRAVLLDPAAAPEAAGRYREFYSSARLRRLALRLHGSRHHDLWEGVQLVFDALGAEGGCPPLGLPGIGGLFEPGALDQPLDGARLPNHALLGAVKALAVVTDRDGGGRRRTVDFRNLGSEELGSVYEGLLELHPGYDPDERTYTLERLAGHERKTTGSYYTPSSLVELLLDTALDPLLDRAEAADDPVAALLDVTVCDPACGSGHFLIAAARRIARRVAAAESGELEPPPEAVRSALRRVVSRCIYGVDVNPMAAELAKVTLWLEAMEPGRPLAFLDPHIRVGNSLLGVTPRLLADGIPDHAYKPLEGDDRKVVAALKKQNKEERDYDDDLFTSAGVPVANVTLAKETEAIAHADLPRSLADVHVQERRNRDLEPERRRLQQVANAWCAAFVQPKTEETRGTAITQATLERLHRADSRLDPVRETVEDLARDYRFFHWHLEFPHIFRVPEANQVDPETGWTGGFTSVIGNPPWERVKLQEHEFFASRDEAIANAANAAARKKLIAALDVTDPVLAAEWYATQRRSDGVSHLLRDSGRYPLCGVGDINTYSVFAEHFRTAIARAGRMGIITPTGLATDATTSAFFADTLRAGRLAAFYDFENEAKIFPNVHNQFRFAVACLTGGERVGEARLAFVVRHAPDVPSRRFALAPEEVLLLNPNTGTLPLFRSRTDAEITVGIYRRHPVLIRDGDAHGNRWALRFTRMFDMANDSGWFRTADDLAAEDAGFDGWGWSKGDEHRLPLYEAKLLSHYDHRFSTYSDATQAQLNKGTLPHLTDGQHDDPDHEALARYWLSDSDVAEAIGDRWDRDWLLGWRDIARASDARTFVPSVLPRSAVGHKLPLAFPARPDHVPLVQAVWSSLAFDYVSRQKISGTGMTYFIVKQLACPAPDTFEQTQPWTGGVTLREWVVPRVIELSYTSWRIRAYAVDNGDDGPPFRWLPERRELIRAELDAAMFHVYGLTRPEVEHVLDSFFVVRKYEERDHGEFRTKRLVLDRYDAMAEAARTGHPYQTILDPPPGHGPRHHGSRADFGGDSHMRSES
jgi:hypothetical protein